MFLVDVVDVAAIRRRQVRAKLSPFVASLRRRGEIWFPDDAAANAWIDAAVEEVELWFACGATIH